MIANLFDVSTVTTAALTYIGLAIQIIILFLIGYIVGMVVSKLLQKVLGAAELEKTLVRYGATTSNLWASITEFVSQYIKWYIVVGALNVLEISVLSYLLVFMSNLLWFIVLLVVGLMLGGIVFKVVKNGLVTVGVEAELEKHKIAHAFGGIELSSILAGIIKWYLVLLFAAQGIAKLGLPRLSMFVDGLLDYIPSAILGVLVLLVALLIAKFVGVRLMARKLAFAEILALGAEAVIIFFGIVLALPKFGVVNVGILEDSFKILAAGLSLGLAIAIGLGLKEPISKIGST